MDRLQRATMMTCATLVGCSSEAVRQDGGLPVDTRSDTRAVPPCDVTKPFGAPSLVDGVNSSDDDRWGWQTADQLTIYFSRALAGGNAFDLFVATRAQPEAAFTGARILATSTMYTEARPVVTGDGLTLYMEYVDSKADIRVATRADTTAEFSAHEVLPVVDTAANEFNPWTSEDGLTLYFTSDRDGFNDIFMTTRASASSSFETPVAVAELNSAYGDYMGALSRDGLEMFIGSSRDTNLANGDVFHATRATPGGSFGPVTKLAELSDATANDFPTWVSADRCELLFMSDRNGGYGIWIARRPE
jgi:hypothetical protein